VICPLTTGFDDAESGAPGDYPAAASDWLHAYHDAYTYRHKEICMTLNQNTQALDNNWDDDKTVQYDTPPSDWYDEPTKTYARDHLRNLQTLCVSVFEGRSE
jgi:hypothetical protein